MFGIDDERCCETCRWWRPWGGGSETGICTSVTGNDYSSMDLLVEAGSARTVLVTNAEFLCRDFSALTGDDR